LDGNFGGVDCSAVRAHEKRSGDSSEHLKAAIREERGNMQILAEKTAKCAETQLEAIRGLMLTASMRGEWLTLAEIAEPTEFGEASISAQLRHLRKPKHGRYCVEKRLRRSLTGRLEMHGQENASATRADGSALWEYRIFARD
jgi:hypothetical protein